MSTHEKTPAVGTQAGAITLARSIANNSSSRQQFLNELRRDAALDYAQRGLKVGPLKGKVPIYGGGFHSFTNDLDTVRAWWERNPGANVGARPPRGVVVLDIDIRNNGHESWELITNSFDVPETLTFMTGSGGWHMWFRLPYAAPMRGELVHPGSGIDLKHHGSGYVVMPPSIHPKTGGLYMVHNWTDIAPVPHGLLPHVFKPLERPKARGKVTINAGDDGAALIRFVAELPDGNRNKGLYWAARRALDSGLEIEPQLTDAAHAAGLDNVEIQRTLVSARNGHRNHAVGGAA